ncbi:MAG: class I SAM-dependent methyltransferase [Planctomycetaceae bacterium]|nr:class I SAM-dependent methyltransferase [Planctomycetaceae bacterium]
MSQLSELNPTTRFSDRVADYVRYRPSYPAAAIDVILEALGDPAALRAADVGAGTGISARLLADRGLHVVAVEPNVDMQQGAEPHVRVKWQTGTAEETGLADNSVDLVLCAQAFHWFRQPEALAEFHRILKPAGRLALMWNKRDSRDPFTAGYRQAIVDVEGESAIEMREYDPGIMERDGLFTPARSFEMPNEQQFDLAGLIGRATSASYVPKTGERFETLRESLVRLHREYADLNGTVVLKYITQVYLAGRIP